MLAPIRTSVTLTTRASPDAVWQVYENPPRWPETLTDLSKAWIEPDGGLVKGAVIRTRARPDTGAVDMRYEVADAKPRERLILATHLRGLRAWTHYTFEETATGARVTVSSELQFESLIGRIVQSLWRKHYSSALASNLRTRTQKLLNAAERQSDLRFMESNRG